MSNWFEEQTPNGQGNEENQSETSAPPAAADGTPPADEAESRTGDAGTGSAGWQSAGGYIYPPAEPVTPPPPAAPSAPTWNTETTSWGAPETPVYPAADQSETPNSGYQNGYGTQGNYAPYGWQTSYQQPAPPPPKPPKKKKSATGIIIGILGVVCAATIVTLSVLLALAAGETGTPTASGSGSGTTNQGGNEGNPNAPTLELTDEQLDGGLPTNQIVAKNIDSAVVLTMYQQQQTFENFYVPSDGLKVAGGASGIVMTADGYIITNWHCVVNESTGEPFARIDVTMHNGTVYEDAKVIGADQTTDLAVIKVDAKDLQVPQFGDPSKLNLGDRVVTIGNAGGLAWTVTQGVLSGLARDVYDDTNYAIKCLQVDAAINPGNSGGPLLNSSGQVIGINSAKITGEDYDGLGFSIPIDEAKKVIDDLLKYGFVKGRIMLGIEGQTIKYVGYEGFQITKIQDTSVFKGTNARIGDIITHINGVRVKSYEELRTELLKNKIGDTVSITLMRLDSRTGRETTLKAEVTLVEAKS